MCDPNSPYRFSPKDSTELRFGDMFTEDIEDSPSMTNVTKLLNVTKLFSTVKQPVIAFLTLQLYNVRTLHATPQISTSFGVYLALFSGFEWSHALTPPPLQRIPKLNPLPAA